MNEPNEKALQPVEAAPTPPAPEPEAGPEAVPPAPSVESLQAEIAGLNDRLLRALAELENLRRQKEREIEETRKYAIANFARGLLEVADNLRRALAAVPPSGENRDPLLQTLVLGIEMTEKSLLSFFERHQIRKVEPKPGDRFDPNLHQAMFEVPTDALPAGAIAEVLQAGYVLADRLLRPALVGVAKAPPAENAKPTARGATVDTRV